MKDDFIILAALGTTRRGGAVEYYGMMDEDLVPLVKAEQDGATPRCSTCSRILSFVVDFHCLIDGLISQI